MIVKDDLDQWIACDGIGCDAVLDVFPRDDFLAMVQDAKANDWRVRPDGEGGYSHHCSHCKALSRIAEQRRKFGL